MHRDPNARIGGELSFLDMPTEFKSTNPYATVQFYLWQAARLVSALIAGLLILWLAPGLGRLSVGRGVEGFKSAGVGLVALVSTPIIALLLAITLVGLPIAMFGVFS